ncbi:MAG: UvrD-helicase domain-containing protein, partial [Patescibacteria group bacterium]
MHDTEFEKRYKVLNAEQREAVDAIEGPLMVVAGPGTGKTQILTLRIANILRVTDTNPANILALTFTEAGVSTMRRRLLQLIGADAYSVAINTFHGFCNGVIKDYPEEFPRIIGSQSITEVDQIALIESIIVATSLRILKPFGDPLYYVRDVLSAINNLKREGVDPGQFVELVAKEKRCFLET